MAGPGGVIFFLLVLPLCSAEQAPNVPTKSNDVQKGGKGRMGAMFFKDKIPRPVLSREERFLAQSTRFGLDLGKIGQLPVRGNNWLKAEKLKKPAEQILAEKGDRGIVLRVENFSNRHLGDPKAWTRCGYQDGELGNLDSILPASKEMALLHNKKELRSSCGVVSWQVMEHPSKPLTIGGKGLRLFVTWSNLDTVGSNRCKADKRNEFFLNFLLVSLDKSGHWVEDSKSLYNNFHTKELISATSFATETSLLTGAKTPVLSSLVESPDGQLEVRTEMGAGCTTNLTLQVLGKRAAAVGRSDLGLEESFSSDEVWEQMIRQAWMDIVNSINRDHALYGIGLEPLLVDPLLQEPIHVNTSVLGYEVEFWMWNVSVAGISDIKLEELKLERGDSLKNLRTKAFLDLGNISVTGLYKYQAIYTGWVWGMGDMDSEGQQPFRIDMNQATFQVELGMDTVSGCNSTENLVLKEINLPLQYQQVNFDFTNIGAVLGGVVGIIGEMALEMSKTTMVDLVKGVVRSEVATLLCEIGSSLPADVKRLPMAVDKTANPKWYGVLDKETWGWGLETLRRDILAEKFITKIFKDGVARHLSDPKDPVVKLLDPFQLLPASERFRQPGLIKGHVVVCELWLFDLSKIMLTDMQLARNEELTYSALKLSLALPTTSIQGRYRLSNVKVMSVIPAPNSEGTLKIGLTGVTVDLYVVLRAKPVKSGSNASIAMELFEVEFGHKSVKFEITGLASGMNNIANKVTNSLGNRILEMQKDLLNKEIKNILYGFADCLMYKTGQGLNECMDEFWRSLGYPVPFQFPSCKELYAKADAAPPKADPDD